MLASATVVQGAPGWLTALALPVAGGGLYLAGVLALARRGTTWPVGRLLAALAAAGCAAVALSPPVTAGAHLFPGHVAQHLLLTMLAPLLLALSAPVTLALRTLPPGPRRVLLAVLHSRPVRVLTAPVVVVVLELGSLAVLYLTPLYGLLHTSPALHLAVHAHMVATGCLVSWLLAGADPMPGRPGTPVRLGVLVALAAGHAVLAKTLYATTPPSLGAAEEVRRGAQLLYYGGDAVELLLAVAVMAEWWRRTGRRLRAEQRRAVGAPPPAGRAGPAAGGHRPRGAAGAASTGQFPRGPGGDGALVGTGDGEFGGTHGPPGVVPPSHSSGRGAASVTEKPWPRAVTVAGRASSHVPP